MTCYETWKSLCQLFSLTFALLLQGDTNSLTGMGDKTHSTDFSSARSDGKS